MASGNSRPRASRGRVLAARGILFTALRFFDTFGPGQTYTPYVGVITNSIANIEAGCRAFDYRPTRTLDAETGAVIENIRGRQ